MQDKSVLRQLEELPYLAPYIDLIKTSIRIDVFSSLTEPLTPSELAAKRGWHEGNTAYLLGALTSIGFLRKEEAAFVNADETQRFLVKGTPEYMGEFILFVSDSETGIPLDLECKVKSGPGEDQMPQSDGTVDFEAFGESLRAGQDGYRRLELLNLIRSLPEYDSIHSVLDAGCSAGLLGLTVIGDKEERTGVLYDQVPPELIEANVKAYGLEGRAKAVKGNLLTDPIGEGYDLILAIGVLSFVKQDLRGVLRKFYESLNPGGILVCISEGIEKDVTGPWDMVMGYLPYYLRGMPFALLKNEVADAAESEGFVKAEKRTLQMAIGIQDIDIFRKPED